MANDSNASGTPNFSSRSPSSTSASDQDVSFDAEEESADESDFLDLLDDITATSSLAQVRPALATSNLASGSGGNWPYTSLDQFSPSLPPPLQTPSASTAVANNDDHPVFATPSPPIPASSLPHEILLHILRLLPPTSLSPALLVCKSWCQCGVELLWHKPTFPSPTSLTDFLSVLDTPDDQQTFPYANFIRRLNFGGLQQQMNDSVLLGLVVCVRLERLTLAGCDSLSSGALTVMLSSCEAMIAIDVSEIQEVTDRVVEAVASNCPKLQGLNLSGCKQVTNRGIEAIANGCPGLRRIKLRSLVLISDAPVVLLSLRCPILLEVDLIACPHITSLSLLQLFRSSTHLRELSLQGCIAITDSGFPTLGSSDHPIDSSSLELGPLTSETNSIIPCPSLLSQPPRLRQFDQLRYLDLTSLANVTDDAVAGIVSHMPKIRNLILAKCTRLTDESLFSISKLGKHLHYLHLGHVATITDRAVTKLARSCTRLRYIDLACCNRLTDMSVFELAANLPRLKRIGLVRVVNLTDEAIYALFPRTSLERIHLSYCDNLTVQAISDLLNHLPRLTHLSLTGVSSFRRRDLQEWCRPPPKDFNVHQQQSFCVYSGKGVSDLRRYLRSLSTVGVVRQHFTADEDDSMDETNRNLLTNGRHAGPVNPGGGMAAAINVAFATRNRRRQQQQQQQPQQIPNGGLVHPNGPFTAAQQMLMQQLGPEVDGTQHHPRLLPLSNADATHAQPQRNHHPSRRATIPPPTPGGITSTGVAIPPLMRRHHPIPPIPAYRGGRGGPTPSSSAVASGSGTTRTTSSIDPRVQIDYNSHPIASDALDPPFEHPAGRFVADWAAPWPGSHVSGREAGEVDFDMLAGTAEPPTPRARNTPLAYHLAIVPPEPTEAPTTVPLVGGGRRRGATLTSRNFRREGIVDDGRLEEDGSEIEDEESEEEEDDDAEMEL